MFKIFTLVVVSFHIYSYDLKISFWTLVSTKNWPFPLLENLMITRCHDTCMVRSIKRGTDGEYTENNNLGIWWEVQGRFCSCIRTKYDTAWYTSSVKNVQKCNTIKILLWQGRGHLRRGSRPFRRPVLTDLSVAHS